MERPQVRQIEAQEVDEIKEVTGWEAEEILRKYGHTQEFSTRRPEFNPDSELSFEEMIQQKERSEKFEKELRSNRANGPKPITFRGDDGYDSEVKWGTDEEMGFSFKIEISTDMNLPKY